MKKSGFGKFLAGVAIGAGIGILFAPKSGKETRADIKKKCDEMIEKAKNLSAEDVKKAIIKKANEIKKGLKELDKEKITKAAKEKAMYTDMAQKIEGLTVTITKRAGDKGRLFGSVTSAELADEISKLAKVDVDKKLIVADHIKETGEHAVTIRFTGDVKAHLKVVVVAEEVKVD